jgi:hypothetical protein
MNKRWLLSAAVGLAGLGVVAVANASPASPVISSAKSLTEQSAVEKVWHHRRCHWVRHCWIGRWGHKHCRWVRRCHHW